MSLIKVSNHAHIDNALTLLEDDKELNQPESYTNASTSSGLPMNGHSGGRQIICLSVSWVAHLEY